MNKVLALPFSWGHQRRLPEGAVLSLTGVDKLGNIGNTLSGKLTHDN